MSDSNPVQKYELCWAGKREALQVLDKDPIGVLEALPDKSVRYETAKNIFIEGENLETLKLLLKDLEGRIKLIYIDPPV